MIDFVEYLRLRNSLSRNKKAKYSLMFKSIPECQELLKKYNGVNKI